MSILKVGDVCIWQNQTGQLAHLNGCETTITGELAQRVAYDQFGNLVFVVCYETDTPFPLSDTPNSYGQPSELRLKAEPTSPEVEREYNALIERLTDRVTA
jgi:hypothetical protein